LLRGHGVRVSTDGKGYWPDEDCAAYGTPSVRSSGSVAVKRRNESFEPGLLEGASSVRGSYRDSFLSL